MIPDAHHNDCDLTTMIYQEISHLSSDKQMIDCIMMRIKNFITILDFDLNLDIEITTENEEAIKEIIPEIQYLQKRFDNIISSVISERILHEIQLYHIEKAIKE